jgi:hypothetical protein
MNAHLENFHVLELKFIGPTNQKGSRIRIKSFRFKQSLIIPFDYYYSNTLGVAQAWFEKNGFELVGMAETPESYLIITTTFKPLKK